MPVPSSGAISLNQFHVEAGGTSGTQCSINDSDIRALIGKASGATMSFNEWYGASAGATNEATGNLVYTLVAGSKYGEKTWVMSSFTDNTVNGKTITRILVSTSSIINAGEIRISGNVVGSHTSASGILGYNSMKIGSTTILNLTQGSQPTYHSGTNTTICGLVAYVSSPAQSTQTTTFTFA